jgi:hypothetical protein
MNSLKVSYACRQVNGYRIDSNIHESHLPQAGDTALFEVISLGKHSSMLCEDNTTRDIMPGDRIMAVFGNRYASEQFEGYVPAAPQETYHMLGQGGIVGIVASTHSRFVRVGPTVLRLIGYAVDEYGWVINTHWLHQAKPAFSLAAKRNARIILSVGSSMDSGKTTSAAYLVRGLKAAGKRAAFIKLTGTAFSKDPNLVRDLGADISLDFTECGYPSTYMCGHEELLSLYCALLEKTAICSPEYIVIEIADGLLQRETAALLSCPRFISTIDHLIFSCGDSLSALGGIGRLEQLGLASSAICGMITTSPLMSREASEALSLPVLTLKDLSQASVLEHLRPVLRVKTPAPAPLMRVA